MISPAINAYLQYNNVPMTSNNNTNLTQRVVASLQEMIVSRGLKPGDRFAVEAELEKKLNVSRVALREAVSRLRALGILESRQRVGLIIGKPDPVALFEQAVCSYVMDAVDLAKLSELRYTIEVGAVELAVRRATAAELAELDRLAEEFAEAAAGKSPTRLVDDIEIDFHGAILKSTHNETLMQMHHVLSAYFAKTAQQTEGYRANETSEQSVWEHRAISAAFTARNTERARAILSSHLEDMISLPRTFIDSNNQKE